MIWEMWYGFGEGLGLGVGFLVIFAVSDYLRVKVRAYRWGVKS